MESPLLGEEELADLTRLKSAEAEAPPPPPGAVTLTTAKAKLLVESGSRPLLFTLAILLIPPAVVVVTGTVRVTLAPLARMPTLQVRSFVPLQVPCVMLMAPKVTAPVRVSLITTPLAEGGPWLVTVIVYVTGSPTATEVALAVLVMPTSASSPR